MEWGLLDYLAVCWRRRWLLGALVVASLAVAGAVTASRPARYEARAVFSVTLASAGERVALTIAWQALPSPPLKRERGEAARARYQAEVLDVTLTAGSASEAERARADFRLWLAWQVPHPQRPPTTVRRPQAASLALWRQQIAEIEAALPRLTPTAAPYWTSRALTLHAQVEAALAPEPQGGPGAPVGQVSEVWSEPVRAIPRPWLAALVTAGVAGLVAGLCWAWVSEWYRLERIRRGTP